MDSSGLVMETGDVPILGLCSALACSEKQVMVTQGRSKVIIYLKASLITSWIKILQTMLIE